MEKNGEGALTKVSENTYDLILMDIQLPGMDGVTTMKKIRKTSNQWIPIIALTAFAMKGDEEKYLEVGFDDYVSKPINIGALIQNIETLLNLGRTIQNPDTESVDTGSDQPKNSGYH